MFLYSSQEKISWSNGFIFLAKENLVVKWSYIPWKRKYRGQMFLYSAQKKISWSNVLIFLAKENLVVKCSYIPRKRKSRGKMFLYSSQKKISWSNVLVFLTRENLEVKCSCIPRNRKSRGQMFLYSSQEKISWSNVLIFPAKENLVVKCSYIPRKRKSRGQMFLYSSQKKISWSNVLIFLARENLEVKCSYIPRKSKSRGQMFLYSSQKQISWSNVLIFLAKANLVVKCSFIPRKSKSRGQMFFYSSQKQISWSNVLIFLAKENLVVKCSYIPRKRKSRGQMFLYSSQKKISWSNVLIFLARENLEVKCSYIPRKSKSRGQMFLYSSQKQISWSNVLIFLAKANLVVKCSFIPCKSKSRGQMFFYSSQRQISWSNVLIFLAKENLVVKCSYIPRKRKSRVLTEMKTVNTAKYYLPILTSSLVTTCVTGIIMLPAAAKYYTNVTEENCTTVMTEIPLLSIIPNSFKSYGRYPRAWVNRTTDYNSNISLPTDPDQLAELISSLSSDTREPSMTVIKPDFPNISSSSTSKDINKTSKRCVNKTSSAISQKTATAEGLTTNRLIENNNSLMTDQSSNDSTEATAESLSINSKIAEYITNIPRVNNETKIISTKTVTSISTTPKTHTLSEIINTTAESIKLQTLPVKPITDTHTISNNLGLLPTESVRLSKTDNEIFATEPNTNGPRKLFTETGILENSIMKTSPRKPISIVSYVNNTPQILATESTIIANPITLSKELETVNHTAQTLPMESIIFAPTFNNIPQTLSTKSVYSENTTSHSLLMTPLTVVPAYKNTTQIETTKEHIPVNKENNTDSLAIISELIKSISAMFIVPHTSQYSLRHDSSFAKRKEKSKTSDSLVTHQGIHYSKIYVNDLNNSSSVNNSELTIEFYSPKSFNSNNVLNLEDTLTTNQKLIKTNISNFDHINTNTTNEISRISNSSTVVTTNKNKTLVSDSNTNITDSLQGIPHLAQVSDIPHDVQLINLTPTFPSTNIIYQNFTYQKQKDSPDGNHSLQEEQVSEVPPKHRRSSTMNLISLEKEMHAVLASRLPLGIDADLLDLWNAPYLQRLQHVNHEMVDEILQTDIRQPPGNTECPMAYNELIHMNLRRMLGLLLITLPQSLKEIEDAIWDPDLETYFFRPQEKNLFDIKSCRECYTRDSMGVCREIFFCKNGAAPGAKPRLTQEQILLMLKKG
ncbi:hypothetical protein SK128_024954 [Halocaridina rubra]|uniref:Uncharacterized protein n=1 Tax=Halocaridina rubra TaxID=373956 RepID=A0AAN9AEV8_HALRR